MNQQFQQLKILLWKVCIQQWRHPLRTTFLPVMPLVCLIPLLVLRVNTDARERNAVHYKPFCLFAGDNKCKNTTIDSMFKSKNLAYSPISPGINKFMKKFEEIFQEVIGVEDEEMLEAHFTTENSTNTLVGIHFVDKWDTLPKRLTVKFRFRAELTTDPDSFWNTQSRFSLETESLLSGPRHIYSETGDLPNYWAEGFLTLQQAFVWILIDNKTITDSFPIIEMQRFPFPAYVEDDLRTLADFLLWPTILLIYLYPTLLTVMEMVKEKETQLIDMYKILGVQNYILWSAWFLKTLLIFCVATIIVTIFLVVRWNGAAFIENTDGGLFILFIVLYLLTRIMFIFFISCVFTRGGSAAAGASIIIFAGFSITIIIVDFDAPLSVIYVLFLFSSIGFKYGLSIILFYESDTTGVHRFNFWEDTPVKENLAFAHILIMFTANILFYFLISLYIEAVFPGTYGVPRPWYLFKMNRRKVQPISETMLRKRTLEAASVNFDEPRHLKVGIQVINLTKKFETTTAVDDLTLNFYEGQITALIGHNGAGKTTTMSIITGLLKPTKGTVIIGGHDVSKSVGPIQKSIGICPQNDIIIDELTVREHLYLFTRLKGLNKRETFDENELYLNVLGFTPYADTRAEYLSGGLKRKLCTCIALCGGSKFVLLDEPTTGIDPASRKKVWEFLISQKSGRTIVINTHQMDEADLLADRTAILAGGKLQACGTSFYLKKKYGTGYHLIINKRETCNPKDVTELLLSHLSDIEESSNVGSELTYILPSSKTEHFQKMLKALEDEMHNLGITEFGISTSSMEEVFIKVGSDITKPQSGEHSGISEDWNSAPLVSGITLIWNQFLGMILHRLSYVKSYKMLTLAKIILPLIFVLLYMEANINVELARLPPLEIKLNQYKEQQLELESTKNIYGDYFYKLYASKFTVDKVKSVHDEIFERTKHQRYHVKRHHLGGATFEASKITVWFNGEPLHAPPIILSMVLNTLYKKISGDDETVVEFINHPLPFSLNHTLFQHTFINQLDIKRGIVEGFLFSLSLVVGLYTMERLTKVKHQLRITGLKSYVYWISSILFDVLILIISIIIVLIALASIKAEKYSSPEDLGRLTFIIMLFIGCSLPCIYCASYLFPGAISAAIIIFIYNYLMGPVLATIKIYVEQIGKQHLADQLEIVFLLFPPFQFADAVVSSYKMRKMKQACSEFVTKCAKHHQYTTGRCEKMVKEKNVDCYDMDRSYFGISQRGIGLHMLMALSGATLFSLMLIFIDINVCRRMRTKVRNINRVLFTQTTDSDVLMEYKKIRTTHEDELKYEYVLVLKNVSKNYNGVQAIRNVCLGIKQRECFGLLGVNGAGKTTLFRIMTGDLTMTTGIIFLKGFNITNEENKTKQYMGYCPQNDALLPTVKVKHTLIIYCLIRGIPVDQVHHVSRQVAKAFGVWKYYHKRIEQLSCGNRRKLSVAVALIGNSPMIYLDEPTTSMDPTSKRLIWNIICNLRDEGRCIILTSASMEECEALCTRLAILVQGEFKCLGSVQHLKNKFVHGCSVTVKATKDSTSEYMGFVNFYFETAFPTAVLKERHREMLRYNVEGDTLKWSEMFGIMEKAKTDLGLEDYCIGQTTLEQVFLAFTVEED